MNSPLVKQLSAFALIYLTVAAGGSWFLASQGSPELVPAALTAELLAAVGLVVWFRVNERVWRPYLWPALLLATVGVLGPAYYARKAPWAMTLDFLAPELPLSEFDSLDTRLRTKVKLRGRVLWWDEYPFGKGLIDPVKLRVENETGTTEVIVDRTILDREFEAGQEVRMVGQIRKWEGQMIRFVALKVTFLDPPPGEEED